MSIKEKNIKKFIIFPSLGLRMFCEEDQSRGI